MPLKKFDETNYIKVKIFIVCCAMSLLVMKIVDIIYIYEKFANMCLEYFELYLCHYCNSSILTWDDILEVTGIKTKSYFRY